MAFDPNLDKKLFSEEWKTEEEIKKERDDFVEQFPQDKETL